MIKKIRRLEVNKIEIIGSVLLAFAFLSFFTMMGVWTIHMNSGLSRCWYDFVWMVCLVCVCLSNYCFIFSKNISIIIQNTILFLVASLLILVAFIRTIISETKIADELWCSLIISSIVLLILMAMNCSLIKKSNGLTYKKVMKILISMLIRFKGMLFVIISIIGIRLYYGVIQPRWDGAVLYKLLLGLNVDDVFNLYRTSCVGHLSQAYCCINYFLGVVFGDTIVGLSFGNLLLILASIISVYGILRIIFDNYTRRFLFFLSLLYTSSPLILGSMNYTYMDQWIIYLFPIVLYTMLAKKWILHFFFATVMCFTKETALIHYFGLCVGLLISDVIVAKVSWKNILLQKRWYGMLCVGTVWLFLYVYLPNWTGNGDVSIDLIYMLNKLKVFYALDFLWIYFAAGLFVVFTARKNPQISYYVVAISIADIIFVLFSLLFKTVNLARYMGGHITCLILIGIIGISGVKKVFGVLVGSLIIVLQLVGNFKTIDPVTKRIFNNYDVGDSMMVSTDNSEYLSDAMVYNFEYLNFDKALNIGISEVISDNLIVIFPQIKEGWSWFFEGNYVDYYNIAKDGVIVDEYWDCSKNQRVIKPSENTVGFKLCNVSSYEKMSKSCIKEGYYFFLSELDNGIYEDLIENNCVIDSKSFSFGGFTVNRAKIVLNR